MPRIITSLIGLSFTVAACAVGTAAGDGTIIKKPTDAGTPSAHDSGSSTTNPSPDQDSGSNQPPPTTGCGSQTQCGSTCVDTTSDPNNCGACGVACSASETCTNGQCAGSQQTSGNAPPQGTCGHSLCSSGGALDEGCDTQGCTVVICDPSYLDDEFCCSSSWDSQCEQEVTTYCAPYSCN